MQNYIRRTVEDRIKKLVSAFPAVSVTGARQCGKTTMLKHAFKEKYGYVTLDDIVSRKIAISDPMLFVDKLPERAIIDEIQYAPEIMSGLKIRIDSDTAVKGRYILTGSQNFLVMKSFSETLAGRIAIVNMTPLTANEIADAENIDSTRALFENAVLRGTYPGPVADVRISVGDWYESYLSTYIERDVRTLYNIGGLLEFDKFVRVLAGRPGQLLNMSSLASDTGVSVNTIKKWVSILSASGIIFLLYPYSANVRVRLRKTPKVYFYDTGLVAHLNNVKKSEELYRHGLLGHIFENFCVAEMIKNIANNGFRMQTYFYREDKGSEIDFMVEIRNRMTMFEIKSSMTVGPESSTNIEKVISGKNGISSLKAHVITMSDNEHAVSRHATTCGILKVIKIIKELNN